MEKGIANMTALILVVIGGLNWGLIGFFEYNLVDELFGVNSTLSRIIYALVGLAALYVLFPLFSSGRRKAAVAP